MLEMRFSMPETRFSMSNKRFFMPETRFFTPEIRFFNETIRYSATEYLALRVKNLACVTENLVAVAEYLASEGKHPGGMTKTLSGRDPLDCVQPAAAFIPQPAAGEKPRQPRASRLATESGSGLHAVHGERHSL